MHGFLLVADAARVHPDGTFSLLRGGIDRVTVPKGEPIQLRGSVVARVTGTVGEAGDHELQLRLVTEDGQSVAPDIRGSFRVPDEGGASVTVLDFALALPIAGRYTFFLLVDRQQLASWEFRAVETETRTSAGDSTDDERKSG